MPPFFKTLYISLKTKSELYKCSITSSKITASTLESLKGSLDALTFPIRDVIPFLISSSAEEAISIQ
jgi:hypothetical protein